MPFSSQFPHASASQVRASQFRGTKPTSRHVHVYMHGAPPVRQVPWARTLAQGMPVDMQA